MSVYSLEKLFRELRQLSRHFGVRLRFRPDWTEREAFNNDGLIEISTGYPNITRADIISFFFHECGHEYCKKNNKFKAYHTPKFRYTKKEKLAIMRTALRAERYVDKIGQKLMKEYYPNEKYTVSYKSKESQEWLKDFVRQSFL